MSDNSPTKNKPSHALFTVSGEGKQARWTKIGVAWSNKDGKGFSIKLDVVPLNGRIVMRTEENGGAE